MPLKDIRLRKLYSQEWSRIRYKLNREVYNTKVRQRRHQLMQQLQAYKRTIKCSRCPENDPRCLDFHHLDRKNKKDIISNLIQRGNSWQVIEDEIKKCEVLCANCHRKHEMAPFYKTSGDVTQPEQSVRLLSEKSPV